ncbi:MAG: ATP synthase F1 subunit delta [Gaiella sp.]
MAVAHRMYAGALFQAAQAGGIVPRVRDEIGQLADALDATPELEGFLSNPQLDPGAKAEVLAQIAEGADPVVLNFLKLIAEKGRAGQLRGISEEFETLVDRAEGRVKVELTTAHELSDGEAAAIVKNIEKASGRQVEATRNVDPSLIGGMILQAGSLRVDASVRGRLEGLRRSLAARN